MGFLLAYGSAIDHALITASLALSQYVVLRAGVFSMAPIGVAAVGGYAAAICVVKFDFGFWGGMAAAAGGALAVSVMLGVLLARLRGIFQGVATLGFVLVVQAVIINFPDLTGGVFGTNGIPKFAGTSVLATWLLVEVVILLGLTYLGFTLLSDSVRLDELAALACGVNIFRLHLGAYFVSGLFAGVSGGLMAFNSYSVVPSSFGFQALIILLAGTLLGGLGYLAGPILGAAALAFLPDVARPLAENRDLLTGALLIGVALFLPEGLLQRRVVRRLRHSISFRKAAGPPGRLAQTGESTASTSSEQAASAEPSR